MKNSKIIKILFLDILTGDENIKKVINEKIYGGNTYSETMRRFFGLKKNEWFEIDASKGKFPEKLSGFNAMIIGGSAEDPVESLEKQWMKKVYEFIRKTSKQNIPILGICGGLQFVIRALHGEIIFNPKGREFGSVKITLTKSGKVDPLFKGLPTNSMFQLSHKCMAKNLLPGSKLLASSELCEIQAIAIGDNIRLTQFHLEFTKKQMQALAMLRKNSLVQEGFVKDNVSFNKFVNSIKNTESAGKKVFQNFIKYFALRI